VNIFETITKPRKNTKMNNDGPQTHFNSEASTVKNLSLKTPFKLRGETRIGVEEKKILWLSKGLKSATPRPPEVHASRKPCDTIDIDRYKKETI